jgi:hypothetical protein
MCCNPDMLITPQTGSLWPVGLLAQANVKSDVLFARLGNG